MVWFHIFCFSVLEIEMFCRYQLVFIYSTRWQLCIPYYLPQCSGSWMKDRNPMPYILICLKQLNGWATPKPPHGYHFPSDIPELLLKSISHCCCPRHSGGGEVPFSNLLQMTISLSCTSQTWSLLLSDMVVTMLLFHGLLPRNPNVSPLSPC